MSTAAFVLIVAPTWKQPECPSTGEKMKKMENTQTRRYTGAKLAVRGTTRRKLKNTMPSERKKSDTKDDVVWEGVCAKLWKRQTYIDGQKIHGSLGLVRDWGRQPGDAGAFLDEGVIPGWIVVMVACLSTVTRTYQTVLFQGVDHTTCK